MVFELIKKAQLGDETALDELVRKNMPLVYSVAKRFLQRGYDAEDLYQLGTIGLIKAIRKFDMSYNVKFSTYAVPLITGEIKRFLRDDGIIKVSRQYKETNSKACAAISKLSAIYGREPTMTEIANELGVDIYVLTEAMDAHKECESIYKTVSSEGKGEMYLIDKLLGESDNAFTDRLSLKCAIDTLDRREREIVAYRYFMDETQSKVASRLGISQVQVSRKEKQILKRLKENLKEKDC